MRDEEESLALDVPALVAARVEDGRQEKAPASWSAVNAMPWVRCGQRRTDRYLGERLPGYTAVVARIWSTIPGVDAALMRGGTDQLAPAGGS
jgi:hypothetical protein